MHPPLVAHFVNDLIQVNALVGREEHAQLSPAVRFDLLRPAVRGGPSDHAGQWRETTLTFVLLNRLTNCVLFH